MKKYPSADWPAWPSLLLQRCRLPPKGLRNSHAELQTGDHQFPGKSLVAVVVDYAPDGASHSHIHAKSAFIFAYVLSGDIELQVNDGPSRVYHVGESFYEAPGSRHPISRNASETKPAKLLQCSSWIRTTRN